MVFSKHRLLLIQVRRTTFSRGLEPCLLHWGNVKTLDAALTGQGVHTVLCAETYMKNVVEKLKTMDGGKGHTFFPKDCGISNEDKDLLMAKRGQECVSPCCLFRLSNATEKLMGAIKRHSKFYVKPTSFSPDNFSFYVVVLFH